MDKVVLRLIMMGLFQFPDCPVIMAFLGIVFCSMKVNPGEKSKGEVIKSCSREKEYNNEGNQAEKRDLWLIAHSSSQKKCLKWEEVSKVRRSV